jgi:GrpB-like predicted nucleotidyltransferase (UPF0157 family)
VVDVETYNPEWPHQFRTHSRLLKVALGHSVTAVEHIGSTAVAGLSAKPIMDMAARAATNIDPFDLEPGIQGLGYALHRSGPRNHAVYVRASNGKRTQILHVFNQQDWETCNHRVFRDKLLRDELARQKYQDLKLSLAASGLSGMEYTAGKRALIEELLNEERALRGLPPTSAWDK